jgi:CubicO group peptidase (beta-lactamase class C family)
MPVAEDYQKQLEAARIAVGVTGTSFAYWDGNTLHTAAAGLRNSVTGDPVTVDTLMHVGSITKLLNTALFLQLVDEGKVALEDLVVKHLPELRLRDEQALQRITCGMLLNHTSGINGMWLPEYGPDRERIVDLIDRCADLDQLHQPGEATSYCNVAGVIAGYLTQKLRGQSWYTLVKTRIYEPLEMGHALVDPLDIPRFRCSVGDVTDPRTGKLTQTTRPFLAPSFAPAGSTQMSSAPDQIILARTLLNGGVGPNGTRIISVAAAERMLTPTADFFSSLGWQVGLGWQILPGGVLHHAGGGPGVQSLLYAHAASGRTVVLLTNCDRGFGLKPALLDPILESWTGLKPRTLQREEGPVDPAPYAGLYENNVFRYEVIARDGGLALRMGMNGRKMSDLLDFEFSPAATLHPLGNHLFEREFPSGATPLNRAVRFVKPDATGRMRFLDTGGLLLARAK